VVTAFGAGIFAVELTLCAVTTSSLTFAGVGVLSTGIALRLAVTMSAMHVSIRLSSLNAASSQKA
jgi:hypothetical protein